MDLNEASGWIALVAALTIGLSVLSVVLILCVSTMAMRMGSAIRAAVKEDISTMKAEAVALGSALRATVKEDLSALGAIVRQNVKEDLSALGAVVRQNVKEDLTALGAIVREDAARVHAQALNDCTTRLYPALESLIATCAKRTLVGNIFLIQKPRNKRLSLDSG